MEVHSNQIQRIDASTSLLTIRLVPSTRPGACPLPRRLRTAVSKARPALGADNRPDRLYLPRLRRVERRAQLGRHRYQQSHAAAIHRLTRVEIDAFVANVLPVQGEQVADALAGLVIKIDQARDHGAGRSRQVVHSKLCSSNNRLKFGVGDVAVGAGGNGGQENRA